MHNDCKIEMQHASKLSIRAETTNTFTTRTGPSLNETEYLNDQSTGNGIATMIAQQILQPNSLHHVNCGKPCMNTAILCTL